MKFNKFLVYAGVAILVACTKAPKPETPEGALQQYVTMAFNAKNPEDRKKLVDLSTGDALYFIQNMTDEEFKKHFIDSNLQFVSMKAKDLRQETSGDVSMVYELNYKEGKVGTQTIHTNKKIAYLTFDKEAKAWKIKATKNMKSFIERKEDLVITPETTDKNSEGEQK
jgi:hypothetical protein